MITVKNKARIRSVVQAAKASGKRVGFVPTMGALHDGHRSLVRQCGKECDFVVVSIFINPLQFGPGEDFSQYPRTLLHDKKLLISEGVDILFTPTAQKMYGPEFSTRINEEVLASTLCGKARPGHFSGVCTIVAKLFNLIMPDIAYFGQKDYQQVRVLERMVYDLDMPVRIKILPIVREHDNLALSSRNRYLDPSQREKSRCLFRALCVGRDLIRQGQHDTKKIIAAMRRSIGATSGVRIDYIAVVDAKSLQPLVRVKGRVCLALAVFIGRVRLIDNMVIHAR